jgi:hypothetical protein
MGEAIRSLSEQEIKEIIYKELPKLVREHPEVRSFLQDMLKQCPYKEVSESRFEILLEEIKKMREESERRWQESERKWRELKEESERRWQESERKWRELKEESDKRWQEVMGEIKRLHRLYDVGVGAIGARWGFQAESTFREAIKGILEESFPVRVERYVGMDEEGKVFGRPDQVELDLIIKDGETIAGEIKSSMSKSDVYAFYRKVKFYEEKEGRKVRRMIIISPMIETQAKKVAKDLGIEFYTYPDNIEEL